MRGERSSLLRQLTPLLAVVALLAPPAATASSFSPDPPPGSDVLKPDAVPSAAAAPVKTRALATRHAFPVVVRTVVVHAPAPVVRSAPVQRTVVKRTVPPHAKPKPKPKPKLSLPTLPPVLVPRLVEGPLAGDPPRALAALALALAALTALSGAGVVFSWSRR